MSRTVRHRRPLQPGDFVPASYDRDHHCHVLGCYGQPASDRYKLGEPRIKPSDQRRLDAAEVDR